MQKVNAGRTTMEYRDFRNRAGARYVFAAPRYSSFDSLVQFENPFNCINEFDVVPRVPPSILGYANSLAEFDLRGSPYLELEAPRKSMFIEWLRALVELMRCTLAVSDSPARN